MTKTINPEMQAAPYLGGTSYDPIEFFRRFGERKRADIKEEKKKKELANASVLQELLVEVKGWEDQRGLEEIMSERKKLVGAFTEFRRMGMNLGSPNTTEEIVSNTKIQEGLDRLKHKINSWNQQKTMYDFYMKELSKPGAEETTDIEGTKKNIMDILSSTDILERGTKLGSLIIRKPDVNSVNEFIAKNKDRLYKPPVNTAASIDEQGITHTTTSPMESPEETEKIEQSYKNLYATADETVKKGLQEVRKRNAVQDKANGFDSLSDAEYFALMYERPVWNKYSERLSKTGSGLGIDVTVFGGKRKINPGIFRDEPLHYGKYTPTGTYQFNTKEKINFNVGRNGAQQFASDDWEELDDGNVEANLLYYDPKGDYFIFQTGETGNTPYTMNNTTIRIPRAAFGKSVDDLPVTTMDGKVKKLVEVFGPVKSIKKTIGGKDYSSDGGVYLPSKK